MVDFNHDYWHAMDKNPEQVSPGDVGISMGIGDPWTNIKTAVTAGASHVELGFMGAGKGSLSSPVGVTPESISKAKREDIRAFSKLNKVNVTTHASANVFGFSGIGENGFSDSGAEKHIHEVERALSFAADVSDGGAVTIHTGEFPGEFSTIRGEKFERYPGESEKGAIGLVNKKTGQIVSNFRKDIELTEVEIRDGRPVPVKMTYRDYVEKAKKGELKGQDPSIAFYNKYVSKELEQAKAEEGRWLHQHKEAKEQLDSFTRMKGSIESLKQRDPVNAARVARDFIRSIEKIPDDSPRLQQLQENPFKMIEDIEQQVKYSEEYAKNGVIGHSKKVIDINKQMEDIMTLEEFAVQKSAHNIARLGIKAFDVENAKKLSKPLFIAPENVFAEQYGAHPQELKKLIQDSRHEMVKLITTPKIDGKDNPYYKKNVSAKDAEKIAQDHIKANFDIGHANNWRKYFKGSDEDFNKWILGEVDDLVKNKIIGHAHISDNFGFEDEHLSVGEGNAPIAEFVKKMKAAGMADEIIFEPGGQGEGESIYNSLFSGWERVAHSPVYRMAGKPMPWTEVSGYFTGRTFTPSYMSGAYLVSQQAEDNWWSGTPLE